jgi:chromosome partitioning protein
VTINATASSGALPDSLRQTDSYVITVANQKGGVGKTMVALSMAAHIGASNGFALVVDVDPQATSYDLTQVMEAPGYEVVHELDPVKLTKIRKLRNYDTIIVDCPGSLEGGDVLAEVLTRSTFVLIPYDHLPESAAPTLRTVDRARAAGVPYAVVLTKVDPQRGDGFVESAFEFLRKREISFLGSRIRSYTAWPNSIEAGVPITRWNERHAPKIREDVGNVHTELLLTLARLGRAS